MALSLITLAVGAAVMVHAHSSFAACVAPSLPPTGFGASADCQHTIWIEMTGIVLVIGGGLATTFALLLGRRDAREERETRDRSAAPTTLRDRTPSSHVPGPEHRKAS